MPSLPLAEAAAALPSAIPLSEDSDDIFLPAHESVFFPAFSDLPLKHFAEM